MANITPQDIIELFPDIVKSSLGDCFLIFDADGTDVNYLTKITLADLQETILSSGDYYTMLAKLKTMSSTLDGDITEAGELIEQIKEAIEQSKSATEAAQSATTSANSSAADATAAAEEARASIANVDEVVGKAEQALQEAQEAKETADEATEEVLDALAKYVPTGMTLEYPETITYGNIAILEIKVTLEPEGALQNYIFQSDNNSVTVDPNGTLTVVGLGATTIYVIPTNNTSLWQAIVINVVEETMRLNTESEIRLMGDGNIRKN